jgi:predicted alpha/beta superfamily hydrolase
VSVNASSYKTVLENRIAGRKTNKSSWQVFNSADSSMNNVYSIADQTFDFGMDAKKKAASSSSSTGGFGGGGRGFDAGFMRDVNQF